MATEVLSIGYPLAMVINQVYALPARRVLMFSDTTAAVFQQSNTVAFTANVTVTLANGQAELAGGFIRCTTTANITLKALS